MTDAEILQYLNDNFNQVFKIGSTFYSQLYYQSPAKKHKTLREAVEYLVKRSTI